MKTITAICAFCFLAALSGVLYSCSDARAKYYDALNRCTASKGTWVQNNQQGSMYTGLCIYPH